MMFYDDEKDVDDKSKHGNMCHLYESSLDSLSFQRLQLQIRSRKMRHLRKNNFGSWRKSKNYVIFIYLMSVREMLKY